MRTSLAPLEHRIESFAKNVEFSESGCWLWTASLHRSGYGQLGPGYGVTRYAHRWLWLHTVGPIEAELQLDHLCMVRNCVNPDHLEPVTRAVNMARATPSIRAAGKRLREHNLATVTHCGKGHEYTSENEYFHPTRGYRICRKCHAAQAKKWREGRVA